MPSTGPTYRGLLPSTDEAVERLFNTALLWVAASQVGLLRTTAYDTNGNPLSGIPSWDYVSLTQAATTDTYTFKTGGAGGTTVQTIVITYTDSTKQTISTVVKS